MIKKYWYLWSLLILLLIWGAYKLINQEEDTIELVDKRDGEIYKVVQIGEQIWMAENLRYNAENSWLNPENPNEKYGRLYDWETVMNLGDTLTSSSNKKQGICPLGWHVPSDEEWKTLEVFLGMSQTDADTTGWRGTDQGIQLKSTTGWEESATEWVLNDKGTNSSGFNAFPTGDNYVTYFHSIGNYGGFWTSSEFSDENAWEHYMSYMMPNVYRGNRIKLVSLACRCVKD